MRLYLQQTETSRRKELSYKRKVFKLSAKDNHKVVWQLHKFCLDESAADWLLYKLWHLDRIRIRIRNYYHWWWRRSNHDICGLWFGSFPALIHWEWYKWMFLLLHLLVWCNYSYIFGVFRVVSSLSEFDFCSCPDSGHSKTRLWSGHQNRIWESG